MKKGLYILAIPFLVAACTKGGGKELDQSKALTLTTPSVEIRGVSEVVTRSGADDIINSADLDLYVFSSSNQGYRDGSFVYDGSGWETTKTIVLNDGPGYYYAGVQAKIDLNATADIPAIKNVVYAYKGEINAHEDGIFNLGGQLEIYSSAVQYVLKDHNGTVIEPQEGKYIVTPVGLAQMSGFATGFPKVEQEVIPDASDYPTIGVLSVNGDYTPGTYPARWDDGKLTSSPESAAFWEICVVRFCDEGFDSDDNPLGPYFVWHVNYVGELVLEVGKLHTFTIMLSDPEAANPNMLARLAGYDVR